jgi:hypothetical protein
MGVIQGVITDVSTGKPISGAAVAVLDASSNPLGPATFTDAGGNFYLSDPSLDNTANQVEFMMNGYQTYVTPVSFASNNFALAPNTQITINTPAGPVTPVLSSSGGIVNSITGLLAPKPATTLGQTLVQPPVPVSPAINLTWLWVSLAGVALTVGGYFLFRNKGGSPAAPAAAK